MPASHRASCYMGSISFARAAVIGAGAWLFLMLTPMDADAWQSPSNVPGGSVAHVSESFSLQRVCSVGHAPRTLGRLPLPVEAVKHRDEVQQEKGGEHPADHDDGQRWL